MFRDKKSEPLPPDLFENFTQMGPLLYAPPIVTSPLLLVIAVRGRYKRRFVLCILHAKTVPPTSTTPTVLLDHTHPHTTPHLCHGVHWQPQLYSCTDKDDEPADDSPLLPAVGAGIESSMRGLVGVLECGALCHVTCTS